MALPLLGVSVPSCSLRRRRHRRRHRRRRAAFFLPTLLVLFKVIDEVSEPECFSSSLSNLFGSFFIWGKVPNWKL